MTSPSAPDGILRISLISPDGPPTLNTDAIGASLEAVAAAGPGVRVILISHTGPNFCMGGNVADFAAAADPFDYISGIAGQFHDLVKALAASPLPVVAAVQGWAAGGGMSVAAAADIAVAGSSTRFRAAYPAIGLTPDGGMSWTLPRAVGRARALDILLTNRVVSADEALSVGLIARVVADEAVHSEAEAIAVELAGGSAPAYAGIKRLISDGPGRDLSTHLDAEALSIATRAASEDGREGIRAFVERRSPRFTAPAVILDR